MQMGKHNQQGREASAHLNADDPGLWIQVWWRGLVDRALRLRQPACSKGPEAARSGAFECLGWVMLRRCTPPCNRTVSLYRSPHRMNVAEGTGSSNVTSEYTCGAPLCPG